MNQFIVYGGSSVSVRNTTARANIAIMTSLIRYHSLIRPVINNGRCIASSIKHASFFFFSFFALDPQMTHWRGKSRRDQNNMSLNCDRKYILCIVSWFKHPSKFYHLFPSSINPQIAYVTCVLAYYSYITLINTYFFIHKYQASI